MNADQTATVGLGTHVVLQAWSNGEDLGNYMVFTACGATLYPRTWDGTVAVKAGTVDCEECERQVIADAARVAAKAPKPEELAVIDAIMTAYMACNAAGSRMEYEVSPKYASDLFPATAMGHLSTAGRLAWEQLGMPTRLWNEMVSGGENAAYVLNLFTTGQI